MCNLTARKLRILLASIMVSIAAVPLADAIDLIWNGENYRDVKVVDVTEKGVVLEDKNKERITVPEKALSGLLLTDAKRFKAKPKDQRVPEEKEEKPVDQNMWERAWIHGSASNVTKEGFQVFSTESSIPVRNTRSGKEREPRTTKGGVPVFNGIVWVKGLTTGENTKFDRVLWRDGYVKRGVRRLPAFSASKPRVEVPKLAKVEREWTNADGRKMTALLSKVKDGKGLFVPSKGKQFVYEISKLSDADQKYIKKLLEDHEKAVKQLKKDYPWLELD